MAFPSHAVICPRVILAQKKPDTPSHNTFWGPQGQSYPRPLTKLIYGGLNASHVSHAQSQPATPTRPSHTQSFDKCLDAIHKHDARTMQHKTPHTHTQRTQRTHKRKHTHLPLRQHPHPGQSGQAAGPAAPCWSAHGCPTAAGCRRPGPRRSRTARGGRRGGPAAAPRCDISELGGGVLAANSKKKD